MFFPENVCVGWHLGQHGGLVISIGDLAARDELGTLVDGIADEGVDAVGGLGVDERPDRGVLVPGVADPPVGGLGTAGGHKPLVECFFNEGAADRVTPLPGVLKAPSTDLATARSRSASASTSAAALPPNSMCSGLTPASCCSRYPALLEPVNESMPISWCPASCPPMRLPEPVSRLQAPGENPAACSTWQT